jgi:uncharacterized protein (UPF0218 family)
MMTYEIRVILFTLRFDQLSRFAMGLSSHLQDEHRLVTLGRVTSYSNLHHLISQLVSWVDMRIQRLVQSNPKQSQLAAALLQGRYKAMFTHKMIEIHDSHTQNQRYQTRATPTRTSALSH